MDLLDLISPGRDSCKIIQHQEMRPISMIFISYQKNESEIIVIVNISMTFNDNHSADLQINFDLGLMINPKLTTHWSPNLPTWTSPCLTLKSPRNGWFILILSHFAMFCVSKLGGFPHVFHSQSTSKAPGLRFLPAEPVSKRDLAPGHPRIFRVDPFSRNCRWVWSFT